MKIYLIETNKFPCFFCAFSDLEQSERFIARASHEKEDISILECTLCLADGVTEDNNEIARAGELIFVYDFPRFFTRASRFLDPIRIAGIGVSGKGNAYAIDLIHPDAPLPDIDIRGEFLANFGGWDARLPEKWLKYYSEGYAERNFLI